MNEIQKIIAKATENTPSPLTTETDAPCVNKTLDIRNPDPIPPGLFPEKRGSSFGTKPLPTLANIRYMFEIYGIKACYDLISKKVTIHIPGHTTTLDNANNTALAYLISFAKLNGIYCGQFPTFVSAIADENCVNPAKDWIYSREWDGKDRFDELLGTLTLADTMPKELASTLLIMWLRSAVAAATKEYGFRNRGVLVLQGPQSIGKTAWVLSLVPDHALRDKLLKVDHHLDPSNKDTQTTAISYWIVELGELESSFKREIARLKGFITSDKDTIRRPYDRLNSEYPRRTVFVATVNEGDFLVDPTGNTRWWTIPVDYINYTHDIDMQQVFAQAAKEVDQGADWWLSKEDEQCLERHNQSHQRVTAIRDMIISKFDMNADEGQRTPMSATEVLQKLGFDKPNNMQCRECGTELRRLIGESYKSKGKICWRMPPLINEPLNLDC